MSNPEDEKAPLDEGQGASTAVTEGHEPEAEKAAAEKRKLDLTVEISDVGPCKKHLKVAIDQKEIKHQFEDSLKSVRKEAAVPGFRPGRAPSVLIGKRFKKEVAGQVKSALLMAALEQIDEDHKIHPISQPELNMEAIEIPEEGPLTFEMDVEVQPDFPLPAYKGLTVKRPVRVLTEADVDAQYKAFLERDAQEVPKLEGGAELGDLIVANLTFEKDGVQLNQVKEIKFRLQTEMRFQDGRMLDMMTALGGAKPGDVREATAEIGTSSTDAALRGQTVRAVFQVLDLKTYRLPEANAEYFRSVGFEDEAELRTALREVTERRMEYQKRQALRRDILGQLVDQTPFDLPSDLVERQEKSTLRNLVSEMKQSGLSDSQLRAREAEIRANAHEITLRNLKEFFILSKIAEAEKITVEDADLEQEIRQIALRTDESERRVRARIEKDGLGDSLATQILERKTLDKILEQVALEDVALADETEVETLDETVAPAPAESTEAEGSATASDDETA